MRLSHGGGADEVARPWDCVRMSPEKSNLRGWLTAYGPNLNLDMMFNLN
ncbi:MAG: hypothetical protein WA880_04515 [Ornithinimicrobium sp.]